MLEGITAEQASSFMKKNFVHPKITPTTSATSDTSGIEHAAVNRAMGTAGAQEKATAKQSPSEKIL